MNSNIHFAALPRLTNQTLRRLFFKEPFSFERCRRSIVLYTFYTLELMTKIPELISLRETVRAQQFWQAAEAEDKPGNR